MSDEKQVTDKPHDKRGIFLTSNSPISLHFVKSPRNETKYTLTYEATSDTPISLSFTYKNYDNSIFTIADRSGSESDASEPPLPPNKKQKRQEERDLQRFWSSETGMLPEVLTRVPKSEHARLIQHTTLLETCYLGKTYIASIRSDNERLHWEKEAQEKEANRLKAVNLELQMRIDLLERQVRNTKTESPTSVNRAVSPQRKNSPSRKSQHYEIANDASPNASIFNHMSMDQSIRREDSAVLHVGKRRPQPQMGKPQPLMEIRTSPPSGGQTQTPTYSLRGTGHFQFATRGRGGHHNTRGGRQPIRGRGSSRYDDAVANHKWQNATFGREDPRVVVTTLSSDTRATATTSGPPTPPTSIFSSSAPSTSSGGRQTRSATKRREPEAKEEDSDEDDDKETLRCDTSRADEDFMAKRMLESYESMMGFNSRK